MLEDMVYMTADHIIDLISGMLCLVDSSVWKEAVAVQQLPDDAQHLPLIPDLPFMIICVSSLF